MSEYILYIYTKKKRQGGYYCCILCIFPWQQHALAIMKFQYTAKLVTPIQEEKVLYSSYFSGIQKCILCFLLLYSCSVVQRCQPRGSYSIEIYVALKKCVVVWEETWGLDNFVPFITTLLLLKVKGQFCGNKASESFPLDLSKCAKMRGSNW